MEGGRITKLDRYFESNFGTGRIQPVAGGEEVQFSSRNYVGKFSLAFEGQAVTFERYANYPREARKVRV